MYYLCVAMSEHLVDIHTHHPTGRLIEPTFSGIHPWCAEQHPTATLKEEDVADAAFVGEIGLDFRHGAQPAQELLFRQQLALAERVQKPVVIHCVKAFEPVMRILRGYRLRGVVFHGFIGSRQQGAEAVKRGYYLSFGFGSLRSTRTVETLRNTPLHRLFLERDESPEPIETLYAAVASLLAIGEEELIERLYRNYTELLRNETK
jgi:TatD DNase family protein